MLHGRGERTQDLTLESLAGEGNGYDLKRTHRRRPPCGQWQARTRGPRAHGSDTNQSVQRLEFRLLVRARASPVPRSRLRPRRVAATSRQTGARRRTRLPGISLLRSDLGARPECRPRAGRSARRPPRLPRGSSHVRASPNAAPLNRVTPAPEPRPAPGRPTAPTAPRVAIGAVVVANSKGVTSEQVDVLKAEWPDSLDVLRPNVKPHLLEEGDANA